MDDELKSMDNNNKIGDLAELLNGCRSIGSVMLKGKVEWQKTKIVAKSFNIKKKKKNVMIRKRLSH